MRTLDVCYRLAFVKRAQEGGSALPAFAGAMVGTAVGLGGAAVLAQRQAMKTYEKIRPELERFRSMVDRAEPAVRAFAESEEAIRRGTKLVTEAEPQVRDLLSDLMKIKTAPGVLGKIKAFGRIR